MTRPPTHSGVYPECPKCDTPYVLRFCVMLEAQSAEWLWQPDCKHRGVYSRLVNEAAAVPRIEEHAP